MWLRGRVLAEHPDHPRVYSPGQKKREWLFHILRMNQVLWNLANAHQLWQVWASQSSKFMDFRGKRPISYLFYLCWRKDLPALRKYGFSHSLQSSGLRSKPSSSQYAPDSDMGKLSSQLGPSHWQIVITSLCLHLSLSLIFISPFLTSFSSVMSEKGNVIFPGPSVISEVCKEGRFFFSPVLGKF